MRNLEVGISRRGFIGGTLTAAAGSLSGQLVEAGALASGMQSPALSLDSLKPTGALDEAYPKRWKRSATRSPGSSAPPPTRSR